MPRNTRKRFHGGRVIGSGGYGCVFSPALRCKGTKKRKGKNYVSKLLLSRHAKREYQEIQEVRRAVKKIPHFKDYFLVYDAFLCKPDKLDKADREGIDDCPHFAEKKNIGRDYEVLTIPNGGLTVDSFMKEFRGYKNAEKVYASLFQLLKNGIVPMNGRNIYHGDIKDLNVLIDASETQHWKARLIDWGLATTYVPYKQSPIPEVWCNRSLMYNAPLSNILLTDHFFEVYPAFVLETTGDLSVTPSKSQLTSFSADYLVRHLKDYGQGHSVFLRMLVEIVYSQSVSLEQVVAKYLANVLHHFSSFHANGLVNLRPYVEDVYVHIVDLCGFVTVYWPLLQRLHDRRESLLPAERALYGSVRRLFQTYLLDPRHTPFEKGAFYKALEGIQTNLLIASTREAKLDAPILAGEVMDNESASERAKSPIQVVIRPFTAFEKK